AYVFWCFDDLLTSAGTWSSAEYARPVTKCGTAVKVVCVRELMKAAEYFTNQKQGCCLRLVKEVFEKSWQARSWFYSLEQGGFHVKLLCCLSSSKRGKLIRAYVFWCFDDLLTSAGTWSSAEYARPVTKCGTAVKVVCVRELVKAAEYFTNQKQGCCLYVW
ncbi:hypothetical protein MTR67_005666, partial [Solanum verrucosum]